MAQTDVLLPIEPATALPVVRKIGVDDLRAALAMGLRDFWAMPTHIIFLCVIYPIAGFVIYWSVSQANLIHLLYPLAAGFALVGPFAAIGLYELSRRRELGLDTAWRHAFDVVHSPSLAPILGLAGVLLLIFAGWIAVAHGIYVATFAHAATDPLTPVTFFEKVLTEPEGARLVVVGNACGLVFALIAASISAISFPLLLDRNVGFAAAVVTSLRVVATNPATMALWFIFVALALVVASIPLFVGLSVVVPILGHATWHLYRRVISPDPGPRPEYHPRPRGVHYAADFPASLFRPSERPDEQDRS